MTMHWMEGFDHMSTAALLGTKGWSLTGLTPTLVAGRIDGRAIQIDRASSNNVGTFVKNLNSAIATCTAGFAFQYDQAMTADATIFRLRAGSTNTVNVNVTTANKLQLTNSGGTVIGTGTTSLVTGNWYYVEVKAFINGASGTGELKLNGASEIASATANFGSTSLDNLMLTCPNQANLTMLFDDVYVNDSAGSLNTGFNGDTHIYTLFPTADGNYSQWTPDSGSPHFSRVNENSGTYPDGDTSYVSDSTSGHRDSYAFGDLAALTGSVFGVQSSVYARKDDSGLRQIVSMIRRSSTDYDSSTTQTLSTSYVCYTDMRETDPSTGVAWVISGVNAAEGGVKVV